MKNELCFSNEEYKQTAMSCSPITEISFTQADAFFLLIECIKLRNLHLYCQNIKKTTSNNLSIKEIYESIRHPENLTLEQKSIQTSATFYDYYNTSNPTENAPKEALKVRGIYART